MMYISTLLSFAATALLTSVSGQVLGEIDFKERSVNLTLESRAGHPADEDCGFSDYFWADVDCNYEFCTSHSLFSSSKTTYSQPPTGKNSAGSWLNYWISIEPTGQGPDAQRWCQGIWDNLIPDCGNLWPSRYNNHGWRSCEEWYTANLHHPHTGQIKNAIGIKFNINWDWEAGWPEGEDKRTCFKSAIEKGTCAGKINFKNGGCYKIGDRS
jgi:hypothetical protein